MVDVGDAVTLHVEGVPVIRYVWHRAMPQGVAPRPYAHPVRTLAGCEVTDLMPTSFLHHLGVSVAIPDVAGHNYWGGRTFVPGHGSAWLDNHGTQDHEGWIEAGPDRLVERVAWLTRTGGRVLDERRTIAVHPVGPGCWLLEVTFTLTNVSGDAVQVNSPATAGRPGAGYGGFFWRMPAAARPVHLFGPAGGAEGGPEGGLLEGRMLNGAVTPWLGASGLSPRGQAWTLVFAPGDEATARDPWFVRNGDYTAVGSALAWSRPLTLADGEQLTRSVRTAVADGRHDPVAAAALAGAARA